MTIRDLRWFALALELRTESPGPLTELRMRRTLRALGSDAARLPSSRMLRTMYPDLFQEVERKIERVASATGYRIVSVRAVAAATLAKTGHVTLLDPDADDSVIDFDGLPAGTVTAYMQLANSGNPYAVAVLESATGERLCDDADIAAYIAVDGERGWAPCDELHTCTNCNDYVREEDEVVVYTDSDLDEYEHYHPRCAREDDYVVRCGISGYYFNDSAQTAVEVDGETVWREYCEEHDMIWYSEDDDEWYRSGARSSRGTLAGYHEVRRSWDESPCRTNGHIGVELELGFPNQNREDFLRAFTERGRFTDGRPFIVERDGSLDRDVPSGCELISSPLPLYEGYQAAASPWRSVLKDLHDYGAAGWRYRKSAGLHVNLCVTGEPDETVMKYAMFINTARAMSCFIAGRKSIYGRQEELRGGYDAYAPQVVRRSDSQSLGVVFARGKYAAVNRRNADCLETRIFGSNLRYEGFMATVEYCVAVMTYVRLVDVWQVVSPLAAAEFRGWLGTQTKRFPNLVARLGIIQHDPSRAIPSTAKLVPVLAAA